MGKTIRTGKMRVYVPHTIGHMGETHLHPNTVVREYVENAIQARSPLVQVYLDARQIVISDRGEGMLPEMFPEDRKIGNAFFENPKAVSLDDLKNKFSQPSAHSLEWVVQYIGLSRTYVFDEKGKEGLKAVGFLAFQSIANRMVTFSRSDLDKAQRFWGTDLRDPNTVKTHALLLPPATEIRGGNLEWEILETDPLKDPWGKPVLGSGTTIVITELADGLYDSLQPRDLAKYLGRTFSEYLEKGGHIDVVDHVTKEGTDTKLWRGGKLIPVQPPSYQIPPIIDEDAQTERRERFHIQIYYDPSAKNARVQLECFHKVDISGLPEFQHDPWLGEFFGRITFPRFSPRREIDLWDMTKHYPKNSAERIRWKNAVLRYEERMCHHRAEVQKRTTDRTTKRLEALLTEVVNDAVKSTRFGERIVTASDLTLRKPKKSTTRGTSVEREPKKVRNIRGNVMNEHYDGESGVTLLLWRNSDGAQIGKVTTGRGGHANFGPQQNGEYTLEIIVPQGAVLNDDRRKPVLVTDASPGKEVIFHLVTSRAPQIKTQLSQVRIIPRFEVLPDPEDPWQLGAGNEYIINVTGRSLGPALDGRDYDRIAYLLGLYSASAVCAQAVRAIYAKYGKVALQEPQDLQDILYQLGDLADTVDRGLREQLAADLKRLAAKAR